MGEAGLLAAGALCSALLRPPLGSVSDPLRALKVSANSVSVTSCRPISASRLGERKKVRWRRFVEGTNYRPTTTCSEAHSSATMNSTDVSEGSCGFCRRWR